jgi:hypothetical protein
MNITVGEFDSIMDIVNVLVNAYSSITSYLTLSVNELIDFVGISISVPAWLGGDITPLALMVGVGLPMYLGYQFIVWVLNIIT